MATVEIAKQLSFEDISLQAPSEAFTRFTAAAAAAAAARPPDAAALAHTLAELGRSVSDHYARVLNEAVDAALGHGDAALKRAKFALTNLKGGVLELQAQAIFADGAGAQLSARSDSPSLMPAPALLTPARQR
jgi:hypothetical protein